MLLFPFSSCCISSLGEGLSAGPNTNKKEEIIEQKFSDGTLIAVKLFNSLTAIGPYMAHSFSWALFKVNNFLNFCPLTSFDSSKCS
jgi:hypothetical protein